MLSRQPPLDSFPVMALSCWPNYQEFNRVPFLKGVAVCWMINTVTQECWGRNRTNSIGRLNAITQVLVCFCLVLPCCLDQSQLTQLSRGEWRPSNGSPGVDCPEEATHTRCPDRQLVKRQTRHSKPECKLCFRQFLPSNVFQSSV